MIRGTTPSFTFTLPMDTSELEAGFVTFAQGEGDDYSVIIDKPLSEWGLDGNKAIVELSQEETLQLEAGQTVEIQMRVRTKNGQAAATKIIRAKAERILKDGEI